MPNNYGPRIVTDGLVMYWDAANKKSYPGTGTIIYDLCQTYNGFLTNGPVFSNTNGGVIVLDGVDDIIYNSNINYSSGAYTVIGAARYSGATRGRMINALTNNWLMGHWENSVANYYAEGWVSSSGAGGSDTNWRIYAASGNTVTDSWSFYINGNINVSNNLGVQGPNGIAIGRRGYNIGEFSTGEFSFLMVYSRVLSASEILQNYNALKGRFKL
jgi:hypothetical protein